MGKSDNAEAERDTASRIRNGVQFRADLFIRLNVFPIRAPALRARAEDIPILAEYWVSRHSRTLPSEEVSVD